MARAGQGEEEKRGAFELVSTQMGGTSRNCVFHCLKLYFGTRNNNCYYLSGMVASETVRLSLSAAPSFWLPTQAVAYLPGNGACTVVVDERVLVNHDECLFTRVDCLKTCTLYVLRAPPPPPPLGSKLPISQTAPTASPTIWSKKAQCCYLISNYHGTLIIINN